VRQLVEEQGARRDVEREHRQAQEKLQRLKWLYREGDLAQADYVREKAAVQAVLAELHPPAARELFDAGAYLENLAALWDAATMLERRQIVLALLLEVECDPDTRRICALRPRPSFVPLFEFLKVDSMVTLKG
jgi:hypothetical protein